MDKITMASPDIGAEEKSAVMRVLDSGSVAQGPEVAAFEEEFAEFIGVKHAVMFNSGTAAIHTALSSLEIGPGDKVITTPFTFIGTANPILMQGAEPVFVDIEAQSFNIDANLIGRAIDSDTKAIIPVDLYGQSCDYDAINEQVDGRASVVEDACQGIGGSYKNRKIGSLGRVAAFSLYATKNIMSGEGGVITTDDESIADHAKRFRQHGMSGPYEYSSIGYNYRSTDILAAIARVQLRRVDELNGRRAENAEVYNEELVDVPGIKTPTVNADTDHVYHQYTLRVDESSGLTRDNLIDKLRNNGVSTGIYYPKGLYSYEHMKRSADEAHNFPVTELATKQVLSLPVHPKVSKTDVRRIAGIIKEAAAHE